MYNLFNVFDMDFDPARGGRAQAGYVLAGPDIGPVLSVRHIFYP